MAGSPVRTRFELASGAWLTSGAVIRPQTARIALPLATFGVLMSSPDAAGLANLGLTVPLQVADTKFSVRQGTPDPRQGNNPTCFDSDSVL